MKFGESETDGRPRVHITGFEELSALRGVVRAFTSLARAELHDLDESALKSVDSTVNAINQSLTLTQHIRETLRSEGTEISSFGGHYLEFIQLALATYRQKPESLEPHLTEDELTAARLFFTSPFD